MKGAFAFMIIWIAGLIIADFVLPTIPNPFMMLFGYVVGSIGLITMEVVNK